MCGGYPKAEAITLATVDTEAKDISIAIQRSEHSLTKDRYNWSFSL